jgi:hypothetical protein
MMIALQMPTALLSRPVSSNPSSRGAATADWLVKEASVLPYPFSMHDDEAQFSASDPSLNDAKTCSS